MRQSLIVGARPRFSANHEFPRVPLGKGVWQIVVEHWVNSVIHVLTHHHTPTPNGDFIIPKCFQLMQNEYLLIQGPALVSVAIVEPGSEQYISVVAVRNDEH